MVEWNSDLQKISRDTVLVHIRRKGPRNLIRPLWNLSFMVCRNRIIWTTCHFPEPGGAFTFYSQPVANWHWDQVQYSIQTSSEIVQGILLLIIDLHSNIFDIDTWNFNCYNIVAFWFCNIHSRGPLNSCAKIKNKKFKKTSLILASF